jgi:hypothetical protein
MKKFIVAALALLSLGVAAAPSLKGEVDIFKVECLGKPS